MFGLRVDHRLQFEFRRVTVDFAFQILFVQILQLKTRIQIAIILYIMCAYIVFIFYYIHCPSVGENDLTNTIYLIMYSYILYVYTILVYCNSIITTIEHGILTIPKKYKCSPTVKSGISRLY